MIGTAEADTRPAAPAALHCAVVAAAAALATNILGPPAGDAPAHVFQTLTFVRHGYALWDNYWYAGSYQYVLYSVAYYPVAAVGGIIPVAVASAAFTAWAFASAAGRLWGLPARLPSLAFAATAPIILMVSGMYPFGAGAAMAAMAIVLLQRGRRGSAGLAIISTAAFSPVAFLLLLVVLAAAVLTAASPRSMVSDNRWPAIAVATGLMAAGALRLAFSQTGYYPFSPIDLAAALGFSALGLVLARGRIRRDFLSALFVVYGLLNIVLFLVPSPIGANATRLYSIAALPLLWLTSRTRAPRIRLRWLLVVLSAAFAAQVAPYVASGYRSYQDSAAATAGYWRPALAFLRRQSPGYRVEVVATSGHWEAYYLARSGVSLARGWYRQSDFPQNTILYQDAITPSAYNTWLRSLGISYVLLPDVPLDYSSQAEAALIESGRSGLVPAGRTAHWRFYRVPDPVGIVSGGPSPPRRVNITGDSIRFVVSQPGSYLIRVRYSPYWQSPTPLCLTETGDGMTRVQVAAAGTVSLTMPDPLDEVLGGPAAADCDSSSGS